MNKNRKIFDVSTVHKDIFDSDKLVHAMGQKGYSAVSLSTRDTGTCVKGSGSTVSVPSLNDSQTDHKQFLGYGSFIFCQFVSFLTKSPTVPTVCLPYLRTVPYLPTVRYCALKVKLSAHKYTLFVTYLHCFLNRYRYLFLTLKSKNIQ